MWGVPWASCALSLSEMIISGHRITGDGMGSGRALPAIAYAKPWAGVSSAGMEGRPMRPMTLVVGIRFHCPLWRIRASALLAWAWRGMPSGRIVYFRKSNNFNPNGQTFVKFFMSLRYSLKIIHYLCTRAVIWPTTCFGGSPAALPVEVGAAVSSYCQTMRGALSVSSCHFPMYYVAISVRHTGTGIPSWCVGTDS